jgi:hypothetical protein
MGESDYLDDNLMQKPFSGKEIYIFFFYSIVERKNPGLYCTIFDSIVSPTRMKALAMV